MAANDSLLTVERLKERLEYDKETGLFKRLGKCRGHYGHQIAGGKDRKGYLRISIGDVKYRAHRLAWLYVYGRWPAAQIDHINGDKSDNRIANLREANNSENAINRPLLRNNTTGFKGVTIRKENGVFQARIRKDNRDFALGTFLTAEAAARAYNKAAKYLHGEFANL